MQINKILIIISCVDSYWVWRSLVARLNGVQEAGSSNLLTQTTFEETDTEVSVFLLCRVRKPLELRDAAALPCYSVALLLTNLLTQTTFEETDTEVSVFLLCRVRRPFELLETVFFTTKKHRLLGAFVFGWILLICRGRRISCATLRAPCGCWACRNTPHTKP